MDQVLSLSVSSLMKADGNSVPSGGPTSLLPAQNNPLTNLSRVTPFKSDSGALVGLAQLLEH